MAKSRLYLVTPPALEPVGFADRLAEALDAGDVACVQLRLKDVDDDAVRRASDTLRPVAQSRGVAFLLKSQKVDGSWLVRSRSRPFQTYFESGFPHGKDQFISLAASGWATTALALSLPAVRR